MSKRGDLGRVVVIGGNGFLGHHIINLALTQWTTTSITSIDLRCQNNRNPSAAYHECDITNSDRLQSLLEDLKPDVVIHTASPTQGGETTNAKELFKKVNVDGTQSVVQACQAANVKALVYTSSASVISDNAAAEEIVLAANRSPKLLTTSLRPAGIFGEGDVQTLHGFIKAYRTNKSHVQLGDNTNLFDFTYVGNVAHAHLLAAKALLLTASSTTQPLDHEKVDGEVFIITNDSPCYFWDFARAVWKAAGNTAGTKGVWEFGKGTSLMLGTLSEIFFSIIRKPPTFTKVRATMATMTRYYNITKAKSVLRYEPLWTLQEGVDRGVAWFLEQERKA
ncbi:C-3 sterol dehydrogenase/C-4 decarboxylase family protein [Pochonia chlamydosporia 170]|uniref:C-3 sterol dehydrogenase/C-4 decarboxylase family protein n=1 Tax=Pochonia chlamydosporia 170 TaxID=1380566 RepID=A0A179FCS7_METCM|nr:C-3 sterol dehydrogenase/C-4 decarboxylase family protein [Pochonia chlamydosporia 170]OAQ63292.1 C-3 sterol dehydrogenase/C-4 decarboxylase family protein [Pochonia chlamydosporia 170]